MTNQELQKRVEAISHTFFQRPFCHHATFNKRLRSTGGRYLLQTHNLEFNPKHVEKFGTEELDQIIKHELCHYHLHLTGRGFKHRDQDFRELLKVVGGKRFCKSVQEKKAQPTYRYVLLCTSCKMEYYRKKRMNPTRYSCGRCKGKLKLFELTQRKQGEDGNG
ncbi:MAG TPA: SprT family protein [Paenibacillaceae bacterium]|nr:SprT family protein [Paenibacillaceae bacterium]